MVCTLALQVPERRPGPGGVVGQSQGSAAGVGVPTRLGAPGTQLDPAYSAHGNLIGSFFWLRTLIKDAY